MSAVIKNPRSNTANKTWTTSEIGEGELGISIADQKLFSANSSSVFEIGKNTPGRGSGFRYRYSGNNTSAQRGTFGIQFNDNSIILSINRNDLNGQTVSGAITRFMGGTISIYDSVEDRFYIYGLSSDVNFPNFGGGSDLTEIEGITNPTTLPATTSDCYVQFYGPNDEPDLTPYLKTANLVHELATVSGTINTNTSNGDITTSADGADIVSHRGNLGAGGGGVAKGESGGNITASGFVKVGSWSNTEISGYDFDDGSIVYDEDKDYYIGEANNVSTRMSLPPIVSNTDRGKILSVGDDDEYSLSVLESGKTLQTAYTAASRTNLTGNVVLSSNSTVDLLTIQRPFLTDFKSINTNTFSGDYNVVREVNNRLQLANMFDGMFTTGTTQSNWVLQFGNQQDGSNAHFAAAPASGTNVEIQAWNGTNTSNTATGTKTITLPAGDTMGEYEYFDFTIGTDLNLNGGTPSDLPFRLNTYHVIQSQSSNTVYDIAKSQGQGGAGLRIIPSNITTSSTSFTVEVIYTNTGNSRAATVRLVTGRKY